MNDRNGWNDIDLDFSSPEELARMLEKLGMSLHGKNRLGAGESNFLWHLAEVIRKAGRLAEQSENPLLRHQFGDAYTSGELPAQEREQAFMDLLARQDTDA